MVVDAEVAAMVAEGRRREAEPVTEAIAGGGRRE